MTQYMFQRYEKKYLLSREQYEILTDRIGLWMEADEYGLHTISNIYFDTWDFALIRQSIEKPDYKEKLRLRAYGKVDADSTVYGELKKKWGGVVYKRRAAMTLREARNYLYLGEYPDRDSQILREIDYCFRQNRLKARAYVAYDRTAFFGKEDHELRMTFDRNIRCRDYSLDLQKGDSGRHLLKEDQVLLEVKIPGAMPMWMSRMFSELEIFPTSFSKYGVYYKDYLFPVYGGEFCGTGELAGAAGGAKICAGKEKVIHYA